MTNSDKAWVLFQVIGLASMLYLNKIWLKADPYIITMGFAVGALVSLIVK